MLFEYVKKENPNDPFMLNPKGITVRVPESRVQELLSKGFTIVDGDWKPSARTEVITRDFPLSLKELQEEVSEELDILETTEI